MSIGAMDDQGYATWQTPNLITPSAQTLPVGVTTLFSGAVANYASLLLRVAITASACQVRVRWFNDAALTDATGVHTWLVQPSTLLKVIVPVQANFAKMDVTVTGAVAAPAVLKLLGSNVQANALSYPNQGGFLYRNGIAVAASGTDRNILGVLVRGPGQVCFIPADATAKLHVQVIQEDELANQTGVIADLGLPAAAVTAP